MVVLLSVAQTVMMVMASDDDYDDNAINHK